MAIIGGIEKPKLSITILPKPKRSWFTLWYQPEQRVFQSQKMRAQNAPKTMNVGNEHIKCNDYSNDCYDTSHWHDRTLLTLYIQKGLFRSIPIQFSQYYL